MPRAPLQPKPLSSWPKPQPLPVCTIILLIVNITLAYWFVQAKISHVWAVPMYAMNIFFFLAERQIYVREKRNFDGWKEEVYVMNTHTIRKDKEWEIRMNSIKRPKNKTSKKPS